MSVQTISLKVKLIQVRELGSVEVGRRLEFNLNLKCVMRLRVSEPYYGGS